MIHSPRIKVVGCRDSTIGTDRECKEAWWHVDIVNKKRLGFIHPNTAIECEIRLWYMGFPITNRVSQEFQGRWQSDSRHGDTTKNLKPTQLYTIPIVKMSVEDINKEEGIAKANTIYLTEARYLVSDNPAFALGDGEQIVLLEIFAGGRVYLSELLSVAYNRCKGLGGLTMKHLSTKEQRDKGISKKQFHDLLKKAAQPVAKKRPPEKEQS